MVERTFETREQWVDMKDCPFCLARSLDYKISVTYSENLDGVLSHFMGECSDCGAMGPLATNERLALSLWNARG